MQNLASLDVYLARHSLHTTAASQTSTCIQGLAATCVVCHDCMEKFAKKKKPPVPDRGPSYSKHSNC